MRCWSFIPHWRSHSLFPFMSWRWLLEDHPIVRQVRHSKLLKHHTFRSIWRFEWEHHQTKWGVQNFANQTVFDYGKVNPVSIHEYLIIIPSSHHPISQSFSASGLQNPWISGCSVPNVCNLDDLHLIVSSLGLRLRTLWLNCDSAKIGKCLILWYMISNWFDIWLVNED